MAQLKNTFSLDDALGNRENERTGEKKTWKKIESRLGLHKKIKYSKFEKKIYRPI